MKLSAITVGMSCRVRRGYSVRPAVVRSLRRNGTVSVQFTDVDADAVASIPVTNRQNLFGADVRPAAIIEGA